MRKLLFSLILLILTPRASTVEQWGLYEIALPGPAGGNPFLDTELSATFTSGPLSIDAPGFYDGAGIYRIRFMPPSTGPWQYQTHSNRKQLDDQTGQFICEKPTEANHGPVRVANKFHFADADGSPFVPIGTTCYAWIQQPAKMQDQTLATLKNSPFNKIRMYLLPSSVTLIKENPDACPFVSSPDGHCDLTQFNMKFFQNLDRRIQQLNDSGVQADVILFHPYGGKETGFDRMNPATDDRYAGYVVARLWAYRNIWWSLANEFDLMKQKTDADWDRLFQLVQRQDPAGHLRSIHFSQRMYDPSKPWVTHLSIQNGVAVADFARAVWYRDVAQKPVVFDEVCYEGDIDRRWGNLSAQEMVLRFWMGTIAGAYVGHGETFKGDNPPAWTSVGGVLQGQSHPRLAFLKKILAAAPPEGIDPIDRFYETHIAGQPGNYYLIYFGRETPTHWRFTLPKEKLSDGLQFHVDILDTWNMTITPIEKPFTLKRRTPYEFGAEGKDSIPLPGTPYMAMRIEWIDSSPPAVTNPDREPDTKN
jgi:hypothetical protein